MNNIIVKLILIIIVLSSSLFSQKQRMMWKELIDKKGIKYVMGSKKPYSGRVFDNFKNKGRRLTGEFKNGKMHGEWTFWREDGKTDREESYLLGKKNGEWTFYDEKGNKLGTHQGVMFYTIGQRKGLGIGGMNNGKDGAWYVADKDITNNELIAVQGHAHPALYHTKIIASNLNWISGSEPSKIQLKAKIRYRGKEKR